VNAPFLPALFWSRLLCKSEVAVFSLMVYSRSCCRTASGENAHQRHCANQSIRDVLDFRITKLDDLVHVPLDMSLTDGERQKGIDE
jgi:hypothetical protein